MLAGTGGVKVVLEVAGARQVRNKRISRHHEIIAVMAALCPAPPSMCSTHGERGLDSHGPERSPLDALVCNGSAQGHVKRGSGRLNPKPKLSSTLNPRALNFPPRPRPDEYPGAPPRHRGWPLGTWFSGSFGLRAWNWGGFRALGALGHLG